MPSGVNQLTRQQLADNEAKIRAAMSRLLGGDIPPGGKCDVMTLIVTGVETEQQRPARAKRPLEVREDRADPIVRDVDQRVPGDQASHRGASEGEVRH